MNAAPKIVDQATPGDLPKRLRRYTDIPALIGMLAQRKLTLLDPSTWEDRNDSAYMAEYKRRRELSTLLASCFTMAGERFHHWRVFGSGAAGVCVVFHGAALVDCLSGVAGIKHGQMRYASLKDMRADALQVEQMPFLKRVGYSDEREYRVLFEHAAETFPSKAVPIELAAIESISLSPWLHPSLSDSMRAAIRRTPGCERLRVSRSTLLGNRQWAELGKNAA